MRRIVICAVCVVIATCALIAAGAGDLRRVLRAGVADAWVLESGRGEVRIVHRSMTPLPPLNGAISFDLTLPDRIAYVRGTGHGWISFRPEDPAPSAPRPTFWRTGKAGMGLGGVTYWFRGASLSVPYGLVVAIAALPPIVLGLIALRRRMRVGNACCCVNCGYDLRATPDRCPECGTVTVARAE